MQFHWFSWWIHFTRDSCHLATSSISIHQEYIVNRSFKQKRFRLKWNGLQRNLCNIYQIFFFLFVVIFLVILALPFQPLCELYGFWLFMVFYLIKWSLFIIILMKNEYFSNFMMLHRDAFLWVTDGNQTFYIWVSAWRIETDLIFVKVSAFHTV